MHKFLLVDRDPDGLFYHGRVLIRKFPDAVIVGCKHADEAMTLIEDPKLSAAVVHRAMECGAEELIPRLRKKRPQLPILWVSTGDPKVTAAELGADRFLNYEAWLMIGEVLTDLMTKRETSSSAGR